VSSVKKLVASNYNLPSDNCKLSAEEMTGVQNSNFASKFLEKFTDRLKLKEQAVFAHCQIINTFLHSLSVTVVHSA